MTIIYHTNAQSVNIDKNRVMEFFENQQYEEAIGYLEPAAAADSDNLQVLGYLGYAHYMNENTGLAERYYQRMLAIDSNNLTANQYLLTIYNNPNPKKAFFHALRLVRLQPGKAVWYRMAGEVFHRDLEKDSALLYYTRAYELAPRDYKNATGLADLLIEQKDFWKADSILDKGLDIDSLNVPYLKLRIRSAYEAKNYEPALAPGERLIRLEEPALAALTQVALSYYNLKKYDDCIRVCEYMKDRELAGESIFYYEAKSWAKLKNFVKSNELLQVCLSYALSKTAELYYYNLGENYEATGQFKMAVTQYDTAYYLFKSPFMLYSSGRIYESELKNTALAGKYYAKYLHTGKPDNPDEKKAYEYVKARWGKRKGKTGPTPAHKN